MDPIFGIHVQSRGQAGRASNKDTMYTILIDVYIWLFNIIVKLSQFSLYKVRIKVDYIWIVRDISKCALVSNVVMHNNYVMHWTHAMYVVYPPFTIIS